MPANNENENRKSWMSHPHEDPFAEESTAEEEDSLWASLSAYIDGEATPEEIAQVEASLSADPAYARDLNFLRLTSRSAKGWVEVEPPAGLRDAIFAATSQRQTLGGRAAAAWAAFVRSLAPTSVRYTLAAGALAAAGLAAFVFLPRHAADAPPFVQPGGPSMNVAINQPKPRVEMPGHSAKLIHGSPGNHFKNVKAPVKSLKEQPDNSVRPPSSETRLASLPDTHRETVKAPNNSPTTNKSKTKHPSGGIHYPRITPDTDPVERVAKYPYSPRAGMDDLYQHQPTAPMRGDWEAPALSNDDKHIVTTASATDTTAAATMPASAAETKKENARLASTGLTVRMGHILSSQIPPDPHLIFASMNSSQRSALADAIREDRSSAPEFQKRSKAPVTLGRF